jgi:hypothetical protein
VIELYEKKEGEAKGERERREKMNYVRRSYKGT